MNELKEHWQWLRDEIITKEKQVMEMKDSILEMKEEYQGTNHTLIPLSIEKRWVKNEGNCGGHMEWRPHVDKMIMEHSF